MSLHFQRQLDKIKQMILQLGGLVEQSVEKSLRAYETRNPTLANEVIDGDSRVDLMEVEVEEECLHALALHQPVALDLRYVVSVLKINKDLERVADLAVNIAEQVIFLVHQKPLVGISFDLSSETAIVRTMVKDSLDALVNLDTELAERVRVADDDVDQMHRQMYLQVEAAIRSNPDQVEQLINVLNISRQLERIADHAVNIAEDVIYMARGEILRHQRPHPGKHDDDEA